MKQNGGATGQGRKNQMTNINNTFEGKAKVYFNAMLKDAALYIGANATQDEKETFAKTETENWLARTNKLLKTLTFKY